MWLSIVVVAAGLAYVVYRLGLTIRAICADKSGNTERSQTLRERAFYVRFAVVGVLLVALEALLAVKIATR
jgi:hypothetical protein